MNKFVGRNSQCRLVVYKWATTGQEVQNDSLTSAAGFSDAELSEAEALDLSDFLTGTVSFSKSIGAAAGTFSFNLDSSRDWKNVLKPGMWCLIFMTNEGDIFTKNDQSSPSKSPSDPDKIPRATKASLGKHLDKLRGICYIERIHVETRVRENGAFDIQFLLSGRDLGVVYEQTELFFDYFKFDDSITASLTAGIADQRDRSIDKLLTVAHDLFYAPQKVITSKTDDAEGLTSLTRQWLLPKQMLDHLELLPEGSGSYFGNIPGLLNFQESPCALPIQNPFSAIRGNAWGKLKEFSMSDFHELYLELDDAGKPKLTFRPIPWGIDQSKYPTIAQFIDSYFTFVNDNAILIKPEQVIGTSIGEDDHERYNHFRMNVASTLNGASTYDAILSAAPDDFPLKSDASIKRHGFKPMHVEINSLSVSLTDLKKFTQATANKNGLPNNTLFLEFQYLLRDYWTNAVFFESGGLEMIGSNEIRAGKPILTDDIPYVGSRAYYIESYTDEFSVMDNGQTLWVQNLQLTRGIEMDDLRNFKPNTNDISKINFSQRSEKGNFKNRGKNFKGN